MKHYRVAMLAACPFPAARRSVPSPLALIVSDGDEFSAAIVRLVGDRDFGRGRCRNAQRQVRRLMTRQHTATGIAQVYERVTGRTAGN